MKVKRANKNMAYTHFKGKTYKEIYGSKELTEKRKRSLSKMGIKNPNFGKSTWNKGKKFSKEARKKMSLAHTGSKVSKKTKIKMSLAHKGKKPFLMTDKIKKNISMGTKKAMANPTFKKKWIKKLKKVMKNPIIREKIRLARLKQIIPFKNTSIEIKLQNFLKEQSIEFETHYPILGQPDIFIKPNICIFADGCYWHSCPECKKNDKENDRDKEVTKILQSQGYIVMRLWEHEINNNFFNKLSHLFRYEK